MGAKHRLSLLGLGLVIAVLLGVALVRARVDGATDLRYHWVVGQHYTQQVTQSNTTVFHFAYSASNNTIVHSNRFTETAAVIKVYGDGSALVRTTFSNASIMSSGQTTPYTVNEYATFTRLSTTGVVISTTSNGSDTVPIEVAAMLSTPPPWARPQAPVGVGGSWSGMESIIPGFDAMPAHFQVLALGATAGRPTVTFKVSSNTPAQVPIYGVILSGPSTVSGIATAFVDTGAGAGTTTLRIAFRGKTNGSKDNGTVAGTMDVSTTMVITPLS